VIDSVVTFKWEPFVGYRSRFESEHVNTLFRMIDRHYPSPYRRICVTDNPIGIDTNRIEVVPLWPDFANVPNPNGRTNPSCYRRLKLFAPDARETFGERLVSIDLDTVIVGDYILGPNEATWTTKDGVYSYRVHLSKNSYELPPDAKVIAFHGRVDPWSYEAQNIDWIRRLYC
jgi:hypothetical protein